MRNKSPTIALGQMVLDTVIHDSQINHLVKNQSLGGPPSFAAIVGLILSKMYSWMFPPLVYAYTCPQAISFLKKYPDSNKIIGNLRFQSECPQFRLVYSDDKKERVLFLKRPPLQFNPNDFNWELGSSAIAIVGSIFHEFNNYKIFHFLKKRCSYIAFDPQGCFRHLTSDGNIKFRYWWDPKIIENVDCLHISELEAKYLGFGKDHVAVVKKLLQTPMTSVILTRGRGGAILGFKSKNDQHIFNIPAYLEGNIIDETGAGDIFLFVFVNHLLAFQDQLNAVAFATSVTSLFLEQKRPLTAFSKEMVRLRQEKIREKIIES